MFWTPVFCFLALLTITAKSQNHTLGLADGFLTFSTPSFTLSVVNDSQTAYSLRPKESLAPSIFYPTMS